MKTYFSKLSIISYMTSFFASNLSSSSLCNSFHTSLTTITFPFPFDFERVSSASLTFGVTLVVRHDSSLPHDVDGPAIGTVNCAGHRPMYSAAFYQLKK
jgi:hypothetical protein